LKAKEALAKAKLNNLQEQILEKEEVIASDAGEGVHKYKNWVAEVTKKLVAGRKTTSWKGVAESNAVSLEFNNKTLVEKHPEYKKALAALLRRQKKDQEKNLAVNTKIGADKEVVKVKVSQIS
jgi:hypothetical protein